MENFWIKDETKEPKLLIEVFHQGKKIKNALSGRGIRKESAPFGKGSCTIHIIDHSKTNISPEHTSGYSIAFSAMWGGAGSLSSIYLEESEFYPWHGRSHSSFGKISNTEGKVPLFYYVSNPTGSTSGVSSIEELLKTHPEASILVISGNTRS